MEGVNVMDLPSEWVSQEQLRGWCPIMVSKICTNSPQCWSNDKYFQHPLLIDGAIKKNASISISYGSMRVFCSEASLERRFFQYIKACFVEYAQLSEQKCLDHISQRGVVLLCFIHISHFGFVMKHKYKDQNDHVVWTFSQRHLAAPEQWTCRERFLRE